MTHTIEKICTYNKVTLCNFQRNPDIEFYSVALWFPTTKDGEKKEPVKVGAKYDIYFSKRLNAYVVGNLVP